MTLEETGSIGRILRSGNDSKMIRDALTEYLQGSTPPERQYVARLLDSIAVSYMARMPDMSTDNREKACAAVKQLQKLAAAIEANDSNAVIQIV